MKHHLLRRNPLLKNVVLKPRKEKTEQISTVVLKSDMDKLRAVCQLEGYAIKDIIGAAISSFIRKYEVSMVRFK